LQLQRLFKIQLLNEDGASVQCCLALAITRIPENLGNLDPLSKYVQLKQGLAAVDLPDISVGNIVSCAHVNPEIATSTTTGAGRKKHWIGNNHISPVTSNDMNHQTRQNCILRTGRSNTKRDFHNINLCIVIRMEAFT
jgi:hypothetical protein